jgi:hypothetical protein
MEVTLNIYASEFSILAELSHLLTTLQNICSMADGKLPLARHLHPNVTRHCIIWMQGTCWHFRALHGYRSNVWAHDRYNCEGPISVGRVPS